MNSFTAPDGGAGTPGRVPGGDPTRSFPLDTSHFFGPDNWSALAGSFRERRALFRPEAQPGRFRALWSDWEFEAICRFTPLAESDTFRMVMNGKQIPPAAYRGRPAGARMSVVRQLWQTGASVNFARIELFSNPVLALIRLLEAGLHCPVRAHYFATPGRSQALGVHADHDDALVLQVAGEKTWDVYPESLHWPNDPARVKELLRENPPTTLTLGPGGWLFLPRGMYHEVRNTSDAPCTHFTLGFHPLGWGTLVEQALALARRESGLFRDAIPVGGSDEAFAGGIAARTDALRAFVVRAFEANRYGRHLPASELADRAALDAATGATRFRWRPDAATAHLSSREVEIVLAERGMPLTLQPELGPAVGQMVRAGEFLPGELPGDPGEALMLCKFLANTGPLQLVAP